MAKKRPQCSLSRLLIDQLESVASKLSVPYEPNKQIPQMKKKQQCSWSDLPVELLETVALKLSIPDVARFRLVCSLWYKAAKVYPKGPFLMVPSFNGQIFRSLYFRAQNIIEMEGFFTAKNNLKKLLDAGRCVGSSHTWIVVLDRYANPWLLNVFSDKEIELPKRESFPHVDSIEQLPNGYIKVMYKSSHHLQLGRSLLVKDYQRTLISKAIISANPSYEQHYKVVILYNAPSTVVNGNGIMWDLRLEAKLAFSNHGDHEWTVLCNLDQYQDVVWQDNMLYALAKGERVFAWNFNDPVPMKKMIFTPSHLQNIDAGIRYDAIHSYLVPSMGNFLVIRRYIGNRVDEKGRIVDKDIRPLLCPLVCPYRTIDFKVFKLDLIKGSLTEMKSLQDQAVFVGRNQTFSLCTKNFVGLRRDSIYFSDDYWDKIVEGSSYSGHDMGIFNLEEERLGFVYNPKRNKYKPAPFWASIL